MVNMLTKSLYANQEEARIVGSIFNSKISSLPKDGKVVEVTGFFHFKERDRTIFDDLEDDEERTDDPITFSELMAFLRDVGKLCRELGRALWYGIVWCVKHL